MQILLMQNTNAHVPYFTFTKDHIAHIQQTAPHATIVVEDETSPRLTEKIVDADIIFLSNKYDIGWEKAKKVRWVHVLSAGIDNLPPTVQEKGCFITNSSGVHPIPIAEYVIGCMLMLTKSFLPYYRQQQKRLWKKDLTEIQPQELFGKRITIIGAGRIGTRLAELAHAFGMHVSGVVRDSTKQRKHLDTLYRTDLLHKAVKKADFVVSILPLTKETTRIFNKQFFASMKTSASFINVGRGKTVDEDALIDALQSGSIKSAALDVAATEPLPATSILWSLENVFITPHISSSTAAYMDRAVAIFCDNIKAYIKGEPMPNLVNVELGY